MINLKKYMKNSIFSRLFWTFLIIITPMYILGFSIYNWGMQTVQNEITSATISQVSFFANNLETSIRHMQTLQYELLNDEDLNDLAVISVNMHLYDKGKAILRLQQRLSAIKSSSPYIHDINAHIPSIGLTISPLHSPDNINMEQYENLQQLRTKTESQIVYYDDDLILCVLHPMRNPAIEKPPLYITTIELSREAMSSAMQQFNRHPDSGSFMFCNFRQEVLISHEPHTGTTEAILDWTEENNIEMEGSFKVKHDGKRYLVVYKKSQYLDMTLYSFFPEEVVFAQVRQHRIWFWIFSLAAVVIIALYSVSTHNFIHKPLQTIKQSFHELERGNLNIFIKYKRNDEFRYIYKSFNDMAKRLDALINQVLRHRILTQKAELKQLQAQINPHFLYNSFFILSRMIKGQEYDSSLRFCRQLANYFQYITRSGMDEVQLIKEVEHARIYAEIQELRFSRRLKVEFGEMPEEFHNMMVPRLIIQPLIENSFEHGLKNKTADGILRISFSPVNRGLEAVVEDNGEEMTAQELKYLQDMLTNEEDVIEYTGVLNINRRIKLMFGAESGVFLSRSDLGGLKVRLILIYEGEGL